MSDAARIAELERRLRDLERRVPSGLGAGAGLSTQLGTAVARPTQVGFAAKITDAFDPSLGYAWEALVKETDPTVSAVASNPLTGVHAVALDNDETLAVDTVVWLEPDPGGRGYLITNSTSTGVPTVTSWKHVVRAASTGNGTLATAYENGDTLDGVVLATGDRILLKNQTTGSENGIYTVNASGAPARAADADGSNELVGARAWVSEGTKNADTEWTCTTNATITPGSTATVWLQTYPHAFLCEVTTSAAAHDVEQKTYSGGIADSSPAVSFSNCRATTGATLPVGTVVTRSPLPDSAGNYWITPAGYATGTLPGLLSHSTQTIGGAKTFTHDAVFNVDAYVRRGLSVNYDGGGTAASQFVVYPDGPGDVTAFVVSPGDREVHVGPLFASATTYTLYVSGLVSAKSGFKANGSSGLTTTLDVTTPTGTKTITITGGIITAIA